MLLNSVPRKIGLPGQAAVSWKNHSNPLCVNHSEWTLTGDGEEELGVGGGFSGLRVLLCTAKLARHHQGVSKRQNH